MTMKKYSTPIFALVAILILAVLAIWLLRTSPDHSDWPMWGYDDGRRSSVEMELPDNPALLWVRELPAPRRAWPFQYEDYYTGGNPQGTGKLSFDVSYEPVAGGGRLYVPSMVSDKVTAYSTATGEELWSYYAGGPVRFAPVYRNGNLYFVSDDGYLYNVDARSGRLHWKYKGSYGDRMVLGNERLISIWPARGGPVASDGVIYFASGILAFEGVFVHAVCADSGQSLWTNSTSGAMWDLHQHGGAYSYGGPSPQGYLAVSGDKLIVPGGRTPPAVYDRHTGVFLYYRQATGTVGKGAGGYRVHAHDEWFFNHGMMYALSDGAQHGPVPGSVLTGEAFIGAGDNSIIAHSTELVRTEVEIEDRLERRAIREQYEIESLWAEEGVDDLRTLFFKSGSHLGISRDGGRAGLYRLDEQGRPDAIVWEQTHENEVWSMIPADGKLFVVTEGGRIYCYGKGNGREPMTYRYKPDSWSASSDLERVVRRQISEAGIDGGYGLVVGGEPDLLKALAGQTDLHVLAVYEDEQTVEEMRRSLDAVGLYGRRIAVKQGTLPAMRLPSYFAEVVILQDDDHSEDKLTAAWDLVRPYGGKLYVRDTGEGFAQMLAGLELEQAGLEINDDFSVVTREGALPGSGQWTHQYGGASNRTYSSDDRVRAPLGTLWFGGPSNLNALPRHHNGPIPQVVGGKLFILGMETISARCVYTGRELWVKEIPGIGHSFTDLEYEKRFRSGEEVYMPNHHGANFIGSPYVSTIDGVYIIHAENLWYLDPTTGETIAEFEIPTLAPMERNEWGHIMVQDDYLIATVDPHFFDDSLPGKEDSWNATSSYWLLVMDRHNGDVLWTRRAQKAGYRHNAIVAGNDRLYVVDGLSEVAIDLMQRRGLDPETTSSLIAFDIGNGRQIWEKEEDVFGTWLGYYEDLDILLQGGRRGQRRALEDEPRDRLLSHRGESGEVLWEYAENYSGPLGLHENMIIAANSGERSINPLTGEPIKKIHPITGDEYEWQYHSYYGCGTMNSSKHLIKFRSGAAGFTDLLNFGGSANLGGFRAGCTNNLVAADGVLNAPDYTRTCTCSYQLQTSFGFAHMPDMEIWAFNRLPEITNTVRSLGINFGAPGNRRENGVLWLEYPKVYEAGPDAPIAVTTNSMGLYRNHATWIENSEDAYPWVGSYGVEGIEQIRMDLVTPESGENHTYDVTLYFTEPDNIGAGERIFDMLVQGEKHLESFDIVTQAGGPRRVYRVELSQVKVTDHLQIDFIRHEGSLPPVVSGVEVIESNYITTSLIR